MCIRDSDRALRLCRSVPALLLIVLYKLQRHQRFTPDVCDLEEDGKRSARASGRDVSQVARVAGVAAVVSRRDWCGDHGFKTEEFVSAFLCVVVVWAYRCVLTDSLQDALAGVEFHRAARAHGRLRNSGNLRAGPPSVTSRCGVPV